TSIKMLLGMVKPTSGAISINGAPAADPSSRRRVAYVSEQPYLYPYLTVWETLAFVYKLQNGPRSALSSEIERVLSTVKLTGTEKKKVTQLSKGMQQRLNMAQALLGDSQLFILDEPMSGLDPLGRKLFRDIFRDLQKQNKCIFFSTHILDDIEHLCENVVVLSKGQLTFSGKIQTLIDKGTLGTEIICPALDADLQERVTGMGCELSMLGDASVSIVVPAGKKVADCQRLLYDAGIYPTTVQPRRQALETILYDTLDQKAFQ
ncbi:MAG: ABC transporter ATP-binding protein, partial [Chitinivibrionales bacterium]|nr:ABC transporter ATP-binding protein [Chitinivibrionales bacterium]